MNRPILSAGSGVADAASLVARAREVLQIEAEAVGALPARLGEDFSRACAIILACTGRVVVSGIGKSGHVGRKIAATLASTGTPAFFMHPAEASHGDLGMVIAEDVVLALSNSGSTEELLAIVPLVKRRGARLIALTGDPGSRLAVLADAHLDAGVAREACPLNLAPTASTTAAMALGDALAVALLEARGFNAEDFASSHPGGSLGRRLLTLVSDVMRQGEALPTVRGGARLGDAILEISRKRMGMVAVIDEHGLALGVFTDGDLRRLLERGGDIRTLTVDEVMTRQPASIGPRALAAEAVRLMESRRITQLLVLEDDGRLVGALQIHDLLAAKIV
ncbi:MAG: KpsF/GutQ family sugar-phosphate isomerase [Betaproteobacteria bacterium]|nr:KpsF/GutQ family sugar-phosphate isomerase [Betaproteobacteria bacterium]